MQSFGETLRRLRERAGLTQAELGQLIGYSRTAVSRMESSPDPRLTPRVLCRIGEVLKAPVAALLGEVESRGEAADRRQWLQAAAGAGLAGVSYPVEPGRVGLDDVAEIERGVEDLRLLDQLNGGDRLGRFARRLVADAERLLRGRFASEVALRLHRVLGEASVLAGWVAQDAGDTPSAAALYSEVVAAAHLADDPLLTAHACANLALLATQAGQPSRAVQCARAGHRAAVQGKGGPRLRALLAARESAGHAHVGDADSALDAARAALRAFDSTHGYDPAWVGFLSDVELAGILGDVYSRLGQHELALQQLTLAAHMVGRPRNAASWRFGLAQGYVRAGDPGQGAALASSVLPEVLELSSRRVRSSVTMLSRSLIPHGKVAQVTLFQEQARAAGISA